MGPDHADEPQEPRRHYHKPRLITISADDAKGKPAGDGETTTAGGS